MKCEANFSHSQSFWWLWHIYHSFMSTFRQKKLKQLYGHTFARFVLNDSSASLRLLQFTFSDDFHNPCLFCFLNISNVNLVNCPLQNYFSCQLTNWVKKESLRGTKKLPNTELEMMPHFYWFLTWRRSVNNLGEVWSKLQSLAKFLMALTYLSQLYVNF